MLVSLHNKIAKTEKAIEHVCNHESYTIEYIEECLTTIEWFKNFVAYLYNLNQSFIEFKPSKTIVYSEHSLILPYVNISHFIHNMNSYMDHAKKIINDFRNNSNLFDNVVEKYINEHL